MAQGFQREVRNLVGTLGARFYVAPATSALGRGHGLDGFQFYVLGRGGVLGDVDSKVVVSAFGYWHPDLIGRTWNSAQEAGDITPRQAGTVFARAAADFGRAHFGSVTGLAAFCESAEAVVAATDPAGLALFAGWAAEPLPDDLPGRTGQLLAVLREHRGSAHLVAVVASGLVPRDAHALARPRKIADFGWDASVVPDETNRALLVAAESMTDSIVGPAYAGLSENQRSVFVTALQELQARSEAT